MAIRKAAAITDLESVKRYVGETTTANDRLLDALTLAGCVMVRDYLQTNVVRQSYAKEVHNGNGRQYLTLNHYPVVEVERVAVDVDDVMTVTYGGGDASHARAWVTENAVKLKKIVQGVTTSSTLAFSDYATIDTLGTAIDALGWTSSIGSSFSGYPTSELLPMPAWTANGKLVTLSCPDETDIDCQVYHADWGVIYNPYGFSSGKANVYVDYVAGWSPIPEPIEAAVWELVKIMHTSAKRDMSLSEEKIGEYSYKVAGDPGNVLSSEDKQQSALILAKLQPYRRIVL